MTAGAIAVPTIVPLRAPIPGQHKTFIDTNTKIELHSDTPGVSIYYTINGSKPAPFLTVGPDAKNTYKYRQPFRLPGGKKTIKAVGVSEDGLRESHVVTKTFDVEVVELDSTTNDEDGLDFVKDIPGDVAARKEVKKFAHNMVSSKQAWAEVQRMRETENMMNEMSMVGSSKRRPNSAFRSGSRNGHVPELMQSSTKLQPPDTATQALRLQRQTDFLKCVYCFAPRPSDPYARYCNECGNQVPALPQTRMPPPEPGQLGTCVHCKTMVPMNASTCLVCEAPMGVQNQPQASVRLQEKLVCGVCGSANPANLTTCVTCETPLLSGPRPAVSLTAPAPQPVSQSSDGRFLTCSKCGRCNNFDARFCDWCGAKPSAIGSKLTCRQCHASNQPYAKFCASCGAVAEPPARSETRGNVNINSTKDGANVEWMPVSVTGKPRPSSTVATQTVGLFYPSQRQINHQQEQMEEKYALEKQMRDRKPLLTAVSPGRGYWRKQMEHICMHLKAHAQNNAEFRALVAEPRMGKIISTQVHEDGYELSLTVNFALRGTKDPFTGDRMGSTQREFLSTYTEGHKSSLRRFSSQDSLESGISTARKKKKVPTATLR